MPLDYPSSPSVNDVYTFNGKTWTWDGTAWVFQTVPLTTANVAELSNLYFTNARVSVALTMQTLSNASFSGNVVVSHIKGKHQDSTGNVLLIKDSGGNVLWGS